MDVYQNTVMGDTPKLLNVYNTFLQDVWNQSNNPEQLQNHKETVVDPQKTRGHFQKKQITNRKHKTNRN